jgi:hypothetical protein
LAQLIKDDLPLVSVVAGEESAEQLDCTSLTKAGQLVKCAATG